MFNRNSEKRQLEQGVNEALNIQGDFLPDLKKPSVALIVVLVCELLAITLSLAAFGLEGFNWQGFGMVSFAVQWIALASLLFLALMSSWLNKRHPAIAGLSCFVVVQLMTLCLFSVVISQYGDMLQLNYWSLGQFLLISMIISGIGLRYMYLQQQVRNQQQAHLHSQLQALQSRIQPHFLFNCMNTIACLIEVDPQKAEQAIEDLSELFRASLAEPKLVTLRDEVTLCERYLAMEKLRMGERLHTEWQVADEAWNMPIPSLVLQPLLENAIKHGVHHLPHGGTIRIKVLKQNDELHLVVSNPLVQEARSSGNQLALNNVLARLKGHFGEKVKWSIEQNDELYTINIRYQLKKL
ncbi:histidine kinase [uncultured Pseudoteredinibacter sp.]|uniref:sensor histidine kinase n=1 Tax=uncultured Pseudoteredinibacter sp. TaxID=1641701 RepID=UPI00262B3FF8|nr:histidine kinase [uncultured Pseudoteredinibacter sp.]